MSALWDSGKGTPDRVFAVYRTVRPNLIEVSYAGLVIGYLEIVGDLFVALRGDRYDTALEVAQALTVDAAHEALIGSISAS